MKVVDEGGEAEGGEGRDARAPVCSRSRPAAVLYLARSHVLAPQLRHNNTVSPQGRGNGARVRAVDPGGVVNQDSHMFPAGWTDAITSPAQYT